MNASDSREDFETGAADQETCNKALKRHMHPQAKRHKTKKKLEQIEAEDQNMSMTTPMKGSGMNPQSNSTWNPICQPSSNKVDAKKPKMGALIQGHCSKEAWTGEKPKQDWSGLQDPNA